MKNHITVERFDKQDISAGSLVEDQEGTIFMAVSMDGEDGDDVYNLIRLKDGTAYYNNRGTARSIRDLLPHGFRIVNGSVLIEPDEMENEAVAKFPRK